MLVNICFVSAFFLTTTTHTESLAVMPIVGQRVDKQVVKILDEIMLNEIHQVSTYKVIGASDISALLGLEKMKDAVACDDVSCAAEIGGALGTEYLLAAQVGVLGNKLVVSGKLLNTKKSEVLGRASVSVKNKERYYDSAIKKFIKQLFANQSVTELTIDDFLAVGLEYQDYHDFTKSGLPYIAWASDRNQESWLLELAKWTATIMIPITLGMALSMDNDMRGFGWGMFGMYTVSAGGLWTWDLMNLDAVPHDL